MGNYFPLRCHSEAVRPKNLDHNSVTEIARFRCSFEILHFVQDDKGRGRMTE